MKDGYVGKSVTQYGGPILTIVRTGGTDIVGPSCHKKKQGVGYTDYISFKYESRKFIVTFDGGIYCWVREVEHKHGEKAPRFDGTLGNHVVNTHLVKMAEFNQKLREILHNNVNNSHEKENEKSKT